eukprot:4189-Heterococcus_DN1.PRE.2
MVADLTYAASNKAVRKEAAVDHAKQSSAAMHKLRAVRATVTTAAASYVHHFFVQNGILPTYKTKDLKATNALSTPTANATYCYCY